MTACGKLIGGVVIVGSLGILAACNEGGSDLVPTAPGSGKALVPASGSASTQSGSIAATVEVTCEKRVPPRRLRSKISVDGNDLAPGTYRARVTSPPGSNAVVSGPKAAVGDEAEFDFDSNAEPGATPIPANYIQIVPGPDVRGEILNSAGNVVASQGVNCQVK